jgi:hypothetical protein
MPGIQIPTVATWLGVAENKTALFFAQLSVYSAVV